MGTLALRPHPDQPPVKVTNIEAAVLGMEHGWLRLRWKIEGAGKIVVPQFAGRGRADGLWQATCFELFLRAPGSEAYVELNLSPSERWAAYDFIGYREGMVNRPMPRDCDCALRRGRAMVIFDAAVPLAGLPAFPWQLGLSAVIEEEGGVKSYWALAHPEGPADFHHPACFGAMLPAAEAT